MPACNRRVFLAFSLACGARAQKQSTEDQTRQYWNKVYSAKQPIFLEQPTALLVDAIKNRRSGKALDIGMGQGRNSLFLARQGWEVTGFDPSDEGVRRAQAQARKLGIPLHAVVAREETFDLGAAAQWDLIVMTYIRRLRAGDAGRFAQALKPQGIFVYENNNAGEQNELLREFFAFRILRFEDVDSNSDWHPDHKQRVERLVAQRLERIN